MKKRFTAVLLSIIMLLGSTVLPASAQDQEVGNAPVDAATFDPNPTSDSDQGTTQYIDFVVAHADRAWSGWFKSVNLAEPYVYYEIVDSTESYQLGCTDPSGAFTLATYTTQNAYYCSVDSVALDGVTYQGVMYFPLNTMTGVKNGNILGKVSDWPGDFALAMIVAHEFGHHVQDELKLQMDWPQIATPKNKELIADCFSGVWAANVNLEGLLEPGDVEEALYALNAIGHPSHGSGAERVQAWEIGFYGTQDDPRPSIPQNCINVYWN